MPRSAFQKERQHSGQSERRLFVSWFPYRIRLVLSESIWSAAWTALVLNS